jgi:hypothetical protein
MRDEDGWEREETTMAWPRWRRVLEESKRLSVKAVDEYNSSAGNYADFIGTMVRAWLYLMHAEFHQAAPDSYFYRDGTGAVRMIDGEPKAWELKTCVEHRWPDGNHPVRRNIELFIGLRNKIEHRYEHGLKLALGGRAHAFVLNYENELVGHFGAAHSMSRVLRFPIFVESITTGHADLVKQAAALSASTASYLRQFDSGLTDEVRQDERYDFRVRLVPVIGAKTESDLAVNFVRLDELSDDDRDTMVQAGRSGHVIIRDRHIPVASGDKMRPSDVVAAVNARVPYVFTMDHHTRLRRHFHVRPTDDEPDRTRTDSRYCIYDTPHRDYIYTEVWVEKIVREVGTVATATAFFGRAPAAKAEPSSAA